MPTCEHLAEWRESVASVMADYWLRKRKIVQSFSGAKITMRASRKKAPLGARRMRRPGRAGRRLETAWSTARCWKATVE